MGIACPKYLVRRIGGETSREPMERSPCEGTPSPDASRGPAAGGLGRQGLGDMASSKQSLGATHSLRTMRMKHCAAWSIAPLHVGRWAALRTVKRRSGRRCQRRAPAQCGPELRRTPAFARRCVGAVCAGKEIKTSVPAGTAAERASGIRGHARKKHLQAGTRKCPYMVEPFALIGLHLSFTRKGRPSRLPLPWVFRKET